MSDFLMNLARRAIGDKAQDAEITPSPHAALAAQMALPVVAAPGPAPPSITAVAPVAVAPVMREVAQPSVSPAAAAGPSPTTAQIPVAPATTPPAIPVPSVLPYVPPAAPAPIEPAEAATTVVRVSPQGSDRSIDLSNSSAPRAESGQLDVPGPAVPVSRPSVEVPAEVVVRMAPSIPAAEVGVPPALPTAVSPLALGPHREPASPVERPAAPSLDPTRVERAPTERVLAIPRVDRPPEALGPFARPEPATRPATTDTAAAQRARAATPRRPVDVRIGAIEVHVTAPAPPAPSEPPALAGFEEFAAMRTGVRYDGE
jgi:hypothetical protein